MLKLSWDLFIIVIFGCIIVYSYIVGKNSTLKIIIGSYIAILTADGLGNLFQQYLLSSKQFVQFLKFLGFASEDKTMILFKVVVFIVAIVILAIKGGFEVKASHMGGVIGMVVGGIFGFLSAGLIVSTLLVYVSGASFVSGDVTLINNTLAAARAESLLIRTMIDNYSFWFSMPAVAFLVTSVLGKNE